MVNIRFLLEKPAFIYGFAALVILSVNVWQIVSADGGRGLLAVAQYSDAYVYHYSAWFKASISNESHISSVLAFSPYESLLTGSITLSGNSNVTPFIVNSLLSLGSCLLIMLSAQTLFARQTALVSGVLYILCSPILFFSGTTLKTNLVIFLAAVALYSAVAFFNTYRKRWVILFAAIVFICAIERVHVLVLPFVLLLVLWLPATNLNKRAKTVFTSLCLICFVTCYGLSTASFGSEPNYLSPVGLNIYLGHSKPDNWNLRVKGVRNHLIGHREDAKIVAQKQLERSLTNAEVTRFWLSRSASYITENPQQYLKAQLQKLMLIVSPNSYSSQEAYHHWRSQRLPLKFAIVNFSVIFALFIVGLVMLRKGNAKASAAQKFTVLAGFVYLLGLMATIVIERYRVTAFVFMIPIAAYAVQELFDKENRKLGYFVLLALIFAASQAVGRFGIPVMDSARYAQLESKEEQQRVEQQNLFNLREQLTQESLSKQTCYAMQNELIRIGFNRDLKALAIACSER